MSPNSGISARSKKVKKKGNIITNKFTVYSLNGKLTDLIGQESYFTLTCRYSIDRSKDPGHRFIVTPDCEVKVKRGLDGETLDREALAELPEPMYEVHILAKDKGNKLNRETGKVGI